MRDAAELPTPSVTDGETATETDELATETEADTETELDLVDVKANVHAINSNFKIKNIPQSNNHTEEAISQHGGSRAKGDTFATSGSGSSLKCSESGGSSGWTNTTQSTLSQHDLMNMYFRKDTILFRNLDLLRYVSRHLSSAPSLRSSHINTSCLIYSYRRASDFKLVLIVVYALLTLVIPTLSSSSMTIFHFSHALFWCLFHSFGLGLLLRAQSERKFLVRHFLKNYYYPQARDAGKAAVGEAFANWKTVYNLSMCMTYSKFILFYVTFVNRDFMMGSQFRLLVLRGGCTLSRMTGRLDMNCYDTRWELSVVSEFLLTFAVSNILIF